jgi:hypothetical protein
VENNPRSDTIADRFDRDGVLRGKPKDAGFREGGLKRKGDRVICDPPFTNPSDMPIGAKRGARFANKKA